MDDRRRRAHVARPLRVLRRHRPAERGVQPGAAHACAWHRADLRVGHDRHAAGRAALVDRRRGTGGDGRVRRAAAGSVLALPAGRARGCRLPRRGAGRSLRQLEQHRDRPLRPSDDALARCGWRAGDRRACARDLRDGEGHAAQLRGATRFPHQRRLRQWQRRARAHQRARRRAARRDHRLRHPRAATEIRRAATHGLVRRCHRRRSARCRRLAAGRRRRHRHAGPAHRPRTPHPARAARPHARGARTSRRPAGRRQDESVPMTRMSPAMSNPHIRTELPGPNARALIARDAEVISPSYPRDYPFVMSHGRGTEVWDVDGNRFLDFAAGIAVCSTGHAHPQVVAAVQGAAEKFLHISSDYWHEQMTALGERLARIAPMGEPAMSFLCQSGTEAVEAAIKLARYVTGRSRFIGFLGGFHGRTMGSLAFTSSKYTQQKGFFATMPGVVHVPYPNPYRPLFAGDDQGVAVLDYIRMLFERSVPASEVAAILVEPMQGEGGYVVPPDGFLAGLRALCDEHGILLIFDEVQSGIRRTGRMFASQHWGVAPDIMTLAKGMGSGLPIGAMVAKKRLMSQWKRGAHGNTYGGNPITCAAANATIDLVEAGMLGNAATVGAHFVGALNDLARDFPCIGEVRGKGLMIGMELVESDAARTPARALCDAVVTRAFHNGLLLLSCGTSTVRFMPPLNVTREEIDEALALLRTSLSEALAGQGA